MKPLKETAKELLARQERELQEFIKCNPTDAALWPNPFKQYAEELTRKIKRKRNGH